MPGVKEIKNHIQSVKDTQKITNAMYLISSTKLRRAKRELDNTRPYFNAIQAEIKRIFRTVPDVDSHYFYPVEGQKELDGTYGYLVITADKGLAGAYNHNILKIALARKEAHPDTKLFVVGEYGRRFFAQKRIPIEDSFLYPAQRPTIHRARDISAKLLDSFDRNKLEKIFILYTDMKNGMTADPVEHRLLPFHRGSFATPTGEEHTVDFEFSPDVKTILHSIIPGYLTGFVYSALVDSFCSEQNARMTATNAAGENADEMLSRLSVEYNHVRQAAITQEITEIASGALGQLRAGKGS